MPRGETAQHRMLKQLGFCWAYKAGYRCLAQEIRLPQCRYQADLAAYRPARKLFELNEETASALRRMRLPTIGTTAVFEAKQSRQDFLKDSRQADTTLKVLEELYQRRQTLERLLKIHLPSLRKGDSLFLEFESLHEGEMEHQTYARVLKEIRKHQRRLFGQTKFERLLKYRVANLLYLMTTEGVAQPHEIPLGWGWLEARGSHLKEMIRPQRLDISEPIRLALLEQLARKGTHRAAMELSLSWKEAGTSFLIEEDPTK